MKRGLNDGTRKRRNRRDSNSWGLMCNMDSTGSAVSQKKCQTAPKFENCWPTSHQDLRARRYAQNFENAAVSPHFHGVAQLVTS